MRCSARLPLPLPALQVRADLPHLRAVFLDEPLWDLSAPRAACEAYISQVCNELRLDWAAHTLIMRRMKDAIDAASRVRAGPGRAVAGTSLRRSERCALPPSHQLGSPPPPNPCRTWQRARRRWCPAPPAPRCVAAHPAAGQRCCGPRSSSARHCGSCRRSGGVRAALQQRGSRQKAARRRATRRQAAKRRAARRLRRLLSRLKQVSSRQRQKRRSWTCPTCRWKTAEQRPAGPPRPVFASICCRAVCMASCDNVLRTGALSARHSVSQTLSPFSAAHEQASLRSGTMRAAVGLLRRPRAARLHATCPLAAPCSSACSGWRGAGHCINQPLHPWHPLASLPDLTSAHCLIRLRASTSSCCRRRPASRLARCRACEPYCTKRAADSRTRCRAKSSSAAAATAGGSAGPAPAAAPRGCRRPSGPPRPGPKGSRGCARSGGSASVQQGNISLEVAFGRARRVVWAGCGFRASLRDVGGGTAPQG